jgi:hypothetical protein
VPPTSKTCRKLFSAASIPGETSDSDSVAAGSYFGVRAFRPAADCRSCFLATWIRRQRTFATELS